MTRRMLTIVSVLLVGATACTRTSEPSSVESIDPSTIAPTAGPPTVPPTTGATSVPSTTAPPTGGATTFVLSSPDMKDGGMMPVRFTCDGAADSPSLSWTAGPAGTKGYALAMHHVPGPGDTHWYWVVYDIPATTLSVPAGGPAPGTVGTNSVNNLLAYAPPCSKGPGPKVYTITVYALSASPGFATGTAVSRDLLLSAITGITLASSSINVTYERS